MTELLAQFLDIEHQHAQNFQRTKKFDEIPLHAPPKDRKGEQTISDNNLDRIARLDKITPKLPSEYSMSVSRVSEFLKKEDIKRWGKNWRMLDSKHDLQLYFQLSWPEQTFEEVAKEQKTMESGFLEYKMNLEKEIIDSSKRAELIKRIEKPIFPTKESKPRTKSILFEKKPEEVTPKTPHIFSPTPTMTQSGLINRLVQEIKFSSIESIIFDLKSKHFEWINCFSNMIDLTNNQSAYQYYSKMVDNISFILSQKHELNSEARQQYLQNGINELRAVFLKPKNTQEMKNHPGSTDLLVLSPNTLKQANPALKIKENSYKYTNLKTIDDYMDDIKNNHQNWIGSMTSTSQGIKDNVDFFSAYFQTFTRKIRAISKEKYLQDEVQQNIYYKQCIEKIRKLLLKPNINPINNPTQIPFFIPKPDTPTSSNTKIFSEPIIESKKEKHNKYQVIQSIDDCVKYIESFHPNWKGYNNIYQILINNVDFKNFYQAINNKFKKWAIKKYPDDENQQEYFIKDCRQQLRQALNDKSEDTDKKVVNKIHTHLHNLEDYINDIQQIHPDWVNKFITMKWAKDNIDGFNGYLQTFYKKVNQWSAIKYPNDLPSQEKYSRLLHHQLRGFFLIKSPPEAENNIPEIVESPLPQRQNLDSLLDQIKDNLVDFNCSQIQEFVGRVNEMCLNISVAKKLSQNSTIV